MKNLAALGLLSSGLLAASGALGAGFVSKASIVAIASQAYGPSGQFFVTVSNSITGSPACATQPMRFALDPATGAGRAQMEVILAAQAAGRLVSILGTGSCDIWGDSETVFWVQF